MSWLKIRTGPSAAHLSLNLRFRPSAAHRWLACSGSVWVAALAPARQTSEGSEGTYGHAVLSSMLTGKSVLSLKPEEDYSAVKLTDADLDLLSQAAESITALAELEGGEILVETEVQYNENLKGTADVIILCPEKIVVVDLKFGAGRRVFAEHNPQLTIYGLAALRKYPRPALEIAILQPRGVGEGLDIWEPDVQYLHDFSLAIEAAILRAQQPIPEFTPGPHCWGCAGAELGMCPRILEDALKVAVGMHEESTIPDAAPAWWALDYMKGFDKLAKKVKEEALTRLRARQDVPGWALQHKNGARRWQCPEEVPDILAEMSGMPAETFAPTPAPKVIGITEALRHPALKHQAKEVEALMVPTTAEHLVPSNAGWFGLDEIEGEEW